jgi:hypothetical protein
MADHRKPLQRVGVWILLVVAVLLITASVWLLLPIRYRLDTRVEPYDVVGYFETSLSRESGVGAFAMEAARDRFLGPNPGGLRQFGFSLATNVGFPRAVNGWLVREPGETLPAVMAVVHLGRVVRPLRLFHGLVFPRVLFGGSARTERVGSYRLRTVDSGGSATPIAAYAFVGDSFVVSTSRAALSSLFHMLAENSPAVRPEVEEALDGSDAEIQAYLTNQAGKLTDVVRGVEERVAFAALPSADALSAIHVTADIAPSEGGYELVSATEFENTDPSRAREVYSDARFLYGTLRRVARSQEIDLQGEVVEEGLSVTLELRATGIEAFLEPPEEESTEEEN